MMMSIIRRIFTAYRRDLQRNVFLHMDKDCVDSVLESAGWVDDIWVWTVDPDYSSRGIGAGYKGVSV